MVAARGRGRPRHGLPRVDLLPPEHAGPAGRSLPARVAGGAVDAVAGAALLALLLLAVGPHLADYRTLTMRSDSMAPAASAGDLLVVRPQPVSAVAVGQVLAFTAPVPGGPVLTHRVVEVQRSGAGTVVRTRGDANAQPDPWLARLEEAQTWRLVAVVPWLGWAVGALQGPVVTLVCVWLLPLWLCGSALRALWWPAPSRRGSGAAVLVGAAVLGGAAPAQAGFTSTRTVAPGYASSTLQPPATVSASCVASGSTSTATVTWTASPSGYQTGYTVRWTGATVGTGTVTGGGGGTFTATSLVKGGTYTFTVTSLYRSWTSTARSSPVTTC